MSFLVNTSGSEIFSVEDHPELVNRRVRFTMAMDQTGTSSVAVGVEPIVPVAVIEDEKRGAASPWKRNRSK
jgi:hypothetical protein